MYTGLNLLSFRSTANKQLFSVASSVCQLWQAQVEKLQKYLTYETSLLEIQLKQDTCHLLKIY